MLGKIKEFTTYLVRYKKKIMTAAFIIVVLILLVKLVIPPINFLRKNQITPSFLTNLITNKNIQLKKFEGRTNLLLLGIPGKEHDGIDLTDTMIFVSIGVENNDVLLLSLPRDIWLDSLKDKINTAYHYGEEKKQGGGFILAKSSVEEIVGQPIHYTLLIDFAGFKRLIDLVGGVDVEIENSFTDKKFPITGKENDLCNGDKEYNCRYETINFEKGLTRMDGETALKFVRSRNAEGDEGTDFARGKRQQKVLEAFGSKLLTLKNLSPNKLSELTQVLKETIQTDLTLQEAAYLGKFGLSFKGNVRSIPLDYGNKEKKQEGFLTNPPVEEYQRWVLVPRTRNFQEIHSFVSCFIKDPNCKISP